MTETADRDATRQCLVCDYRTDAADPADTGRIRGNTARFRDTVFNLWQCPACQAIHATDPVDMADIYSDYPLNSDRTLDVFARGTYRNLLRRLTSEGLEKNHSIIDFGCGKSYLTFALHHLLHRIHGRKVDIVGLDLKADVVAHCNEIATQLSCHGLRFESGDMAGYSPLESVDLSVSLHACDTATDLALSQAIAWNAKVIFAVPCCHHEVASRLDNDFLSPVMRRGILKERFAELLTDAMRADLLEACGYRTQVLEFISLEHTPRNVLIRAIRDSTTDSEPVIPIPVPDSIKSTRHLVGLPACTLEELLTIRE